MSIKVENIDGKNWKILEEIKYKNILVPKGFVTDFASIPRVLKIMFKYSTLYSKASVIHDYLYKTGKLTRKESDLIFLEIMKEEKVSWFKRRSIYRSVRMFGWLFYKKRNEKKNE